MPGISERMAGNPGEGNERGKTAIRQPDAGFIKCKIENVRVCTYGVFVVFMGGSFDAGCISGSKV